MPSEGRSESRKSILSTLRVQLGSSLFLLHLTGISDAVALVICGKTASHGAGAETQVVSPVVGMEMGPQWVEVCSRSFAEPGLV